MTIWTTLLLQCPVQACRIRYKAVSQIFFSEIFSAFQHKPSIGRRTVLKHDSRRVEKQAVSVFIERFFFLAYVRLDEIMSNMYSTAELENRPSSD